jgi:glycosyltransferase involved in cell wall biosynthesis
VIPVYNEEASIPHLFTRIEALHRSLPDIALELIVVDDQSTDNSGALLKSACAPTDSYTYLRLARNSGSHVAILAGLEHARGGCAIFLASDLQDPPELVPSMIEAWLAGNHVVWAVREQREGLGPVDRLAAWAFYRLINHYGQVQIPPQGSDFALLDRRVIDALMRSVGSNPSLGGEIARLGFKQAQVHYVKARRLHGRSKWRREHRLKAFVDAFVSFSYAPLRAMSYLGIVCSLFGFAYAAIVVISRLLTSTPVEGWASLIVVVLVVAGVQMAMIGVLGEYLWRTLEEARRRPRYVLEDSYTASTPGPGQRTTSVQSVPS